MLVSYTSSSSGEFFYLPTRLGSYRNFLLETSLYRGDLHYIRLPSRQYSFSFLSCYLLLYNTLSSYLSPQGLLNYLKIEFLLYFLSPLPYCHLIYDRLDLDPCHVLVHKNLPKLDDHQLPDHETISINTTEKRDILRYLECNDELFQMVFYLPIRIYLL